MTFNQQTIINKESNGSTIQIQQQSNQMYQQQTPSSGTTASVYSSHRKIISQRATQTVNKPTYQLTDSQCSYVPKPITNKPIKAKRVLPKPSISSQQFNQLFHNVKQPSKPILTAKPIQPPIHQVSVYETQIYDPLAFPYSNGNTCSSNHAHSTHSETSNEYPSTNSSSTSCLSKQSNYSCYEKAIIHTQPSASSLNSTNTSYSQTNRSTTNQTKSIERIQTFYE